MIVRKTFEKEITMCRECWYAHLVTNSVNYTMCCHQNKEPRLNENNKQIPEWCPEKELTND
jgi:hypothetical protein